MKCQKSSQNLCKGSYCQRCKNFFSEVLDLIDKVLSFDDDNVDESIIITDVGKEINHKNVWSIYLNNLDYQLFYQICKKNNSSPPTILILESKTAIKIKELLELNKGGKSTSADLTDSVALELNC